MASDFGLTTSALSPSASLSSTGRSEPRRSERRQNAAGRPAAEARGQAGVERVGRGGSDIDGVVGIVRLVHGWDSVSTGSCFPRIRAGAIFARKKSKKRKNQESAFKRLAASCFQFRRAAGLMERHDLQKAALNSCRARA